jgi:putative oxidoreductase
MNQLMSWLDAQRAYSILICRVVMAAILIVAGYGKLFGAGIARVTEGFESIHLFAAPMLGVLVPLLEFFGGIAILLGLFSRLLSIWVIVQFGLITIYVKPVLIGEGWGPLRIDLLLATLGFLIATQGPGPLNLGGRIFSKMKWAQ